MQQFETAAKSYLKPTERVLGDAFSYASHSAILDAFVFHSKQRSKNWSVNAWSKKLGLPTNGILINILKRRRLPSPDLSMTLARSMDLDAAETEYFLSLIEIERASLHSFARPSTIQTARDRILKLRVRSRTRVLQDALFTAVSKPIHFIIRECFNLKSKPQTADEIRPLLGVPATETEIQASIQTLLECGLLVRDSEGKLRQAEAHFETENERASASARAFHKASLLSAIAALDEVAMSERHFTSYVMAIEKSRVPEAKEYIEECINQFVAKFSAPNHAGDAIYQMGIQFVPKTKAERPVDTGGSS